MAFALLNKALNAPEAGPVFPSSQLKYRYHRYLLVLFVYHRHFSERDLSGSGQNAKVVAPPPSLSLMSHFFSAKIEIGGSSVAVRAGVQLGVSFTSSIIFMEKGPPRSAWDTFVRD